MLATAADIVADPSAPDAFVQGIMEGKEWIWDGGILREKLAEQTQRRINTLIDQKRLEEHKINLFNDFINVTAGTANRNQMPVSAHLRRRSVCEGFPSVFD